MYCRNCGNLLNSDEKFCTNCGMKIEGVSNNEQVQNKIINKPKKGKGIASMILGIIALYFCLSTITVDTSLIINQNFAYKFGYAIGYVLIQTTLAIIGISLATSERKDNRNGFNTSGLILSIISFVFIGVEVLIILAQ